MDNPETLATFGTRHRTETKTQHRKLKRLHVATWNPQKLEAQPTEPVSLT